MHERGRSEDSFQEPVLSFLVWVLGLEFRSSVLVISTFTNLDRPNYICTLTDSLLNVLCLIASNFTGFILKKIKNRAGEMAQWVRAPDCSSEGPEFKSQQPHGGSQPSVTKSDALFWSV